MAGRRVATSSIPLLTRHSAVCVAPDSNKCWIVVPWQAFRWWLYLIVYRYVCGGEALFRAGRFFWWQAGLFLAISFRAMVADHSRCHRQQIAKIRTRLLTLSCSRDHCSLASNSTARVPVTLSVIVMLVSERNWPLSYILQLSDVFILPSN